MRRSLVVVSVVAVVVFLSFAVLPSSAPAVMWDVQGGILMGASGVDVGGTSYDVMFRDGTCISLFGGCDSNSDFTFQSSADAGAASQALVGQVFVDGTAGNFASDASLINGLEQVTPSGTAVVWTPYEVMASQVYNSVAFKSGGGAWAVSGGTIVPTNAGTGQCQNSTCWTYAVWTPVAVPEPTTILMLGSGLVGLFGFRKKFMK